MKSLYGSITRSAVICFSYVIVAMVSSKANAVTQIDRWVYCEGAASANYLGFVKLPSIHLGCALLAPQAAMPPGVLQRFAAGIVPSRSTRRCRNPR